MMHENLHSTRTAQAASVVNKCLDPFTVQIQKCLEPGNQINTGVLFSILMFKHITACSQLITEAADMWSELMVMKGQCGGGKFSNQLGNSGRDRK